MRNDFESNYLQHWGIKKGGKAQNHKYFERVEKNGKYIYFYTQAQYEAWLHGSKTKVEGAKNKTKSVLNSLKNRLSKSNLTTAIARGKTAAYDLATRSRTALTKTNVKSVIDRGNKAISSILNASTKTVQNVAKKVQNTAKAATPKIQSKAKSITDKVSNTLKKAGKDTSKAIQKYVSKGEKTINSILSKAGNTKMRDTKKSSGVGTSIIASILLSVAATAAMTAIAYVAPKVIKKVKELIDKLIHPEETISVETYTTPGPNDKPKEKPPAEFASDAADSYKEDRDAHSEVPQKESPTTRDEDMAAVNKNYEKSEEDIREQERLAEEYYDALYRGDMEAAEMYYDAYMEIEDKYAGYQNNCKNCTLVYDLRRRGYDVDAPWNPNGTYPSSIYDWYEITDEDVLGYGTGSEYQKISKREVREIKQQLESMYPEGAYGELSVRWSDSYEGDVGGHACVWSIENGEAIIRDCQTNQVVPLESYLMESYEFTVVRTDDKKLKDLAYEACTADKTNAWGKEDRDEYEDDDIRWDTREYNDYVEDDRVTYKNEDDLRYDEYWKKAAGKKRK